MFGVGVPACVSHTAWHVQAIHVPVFSAVGTMDLMRERVDHSILGWADRFLYESGAMVKAQILRGC